MDYWITMAVNAAVFVVLIAALSMLAWDRRRLMRENDRLKRWLERAEEIRDKAVEYSDEMEKSARLERNRAEDAAKQVAEAQERTRFEVRKAMEADEKYRTVCSACESALLDLDNCKSALEIAEKDREKAEIEAERARKECAMHEKERRQLEAKILHLKEEYEAQATRADELMQREMANFLGYNGTERGQKELNDGADE